jgi:Arc/MetJ-type ribon-helix-helix transcriptional regulator
MDGGSFMITHPEDLLTSSVMNSITIVMGVAKVTVSIEAEIIKKVDRLVKEKVFRNRSQAVQTAVDEKLTRLEKNRLTIECSKLSKDEERAFADLGLAAEIEEWPEY